MYSKIKKIATLVIASGALVTSLAVSASDAIKRDDVSLSSRIDGYLEAELIAGNEDAASDLVTVNNTVFKNNTITSGYNYGIIYVSAVSNIGQKTGIRLCPGTSCPKKAALR